MSHSDFGQDTHSTPVADKTAAAARLMAARYAIDADDLRLLLAVLGLDHDSDPVCRECGNPISRIATGGHNNSAGDGLCSYHYRTAREQTQRVVDL